MQGSHPLFFPCSLFMLLYFPVLLSGTRLLLAGCCYHKCQACMERCNLSSHHGRPGEPTVLRHSVQINRRVQDAAAELGERSKDDNIPPPAHLCC